MSHSRVIEQLANLVYAPSAALALLVAITLGITTGQDEGILALAAVVLAGFYGFIGARWQRGFYGLLVYLPFSGVVTLAMYPWKAPLLFKDLLFVIPAYLGFLVRWTLRRESLRGVPGLPVGLMLALGILVVVQMANTGVENVLMGLIGLKVWLFYVPLFFLAFTLAASEREVIRLLRLLVGLSFIPSTVGIAEALLVQVAGYRATIEAIYGEAAGPATQGFALFDVGGGTLARIPSTFTFVSQYVGYTLAMLGPCYGLWRGDPSAWWRRVGKLAFAVVALASFLSGARLAFVFVPLMLVMIFALEYGVSGLLRSAAYAVAILLGALAALRISSFALYEHVADLFAHYAQEAAYGGLLQAIVTAPLGAGTGTNTGPARYAFTDPDSFVAIENYYAKAAYELGLPGLVVIVGLFLSLVLIGYGSHRQLKRASLRSYSAGFLAFIVIMALNSFKGWLVDLDPVNVYFWVFAGVLMRCSELESRMIEGSGSAVQHESRVGDRFLGTFQTRVSGAGASQ